MSLVWYALWFVVAVGVLVTVHEFGHFWVARRLGFKVLRFSVGFGRPLLKRIAGADRIEYVVAAVPLGGYVKLLDEREGPVAPHELSRSFTRRPPWQRIVVLLAGPAFNIMFAVLLLWGMLWVNGVTEIRPLVGEVLSGSVAAAAGLRPGDEIRAVNGAAVAGERDVVFGLLDAMSSRGEADLAVRASSGELRSARLRVPDAEQRRRLTEPAELFRGLGFTFWTPPLPPVLGQVMPDGPAARAGLRAGDLIKAIDGTSVHDFREIVALISATISRKSCTEVPSIALMRSPARKPARAAGPSGITCPSTGGSGGVQNVNPSPRKSSAGSVRRRRCSASGTRSLAERSSPELARTARSASPRELMASSSPNTTSRSPATAAPLTARISSPGRRPAAAATEPDRTSPTSGRISVTPFAHSIPHSTSTANRMLKAGPASSTTMRCHGGRRVKERDSSCGATGPSRSSSSFT